MWLWDFPGCLSGTFFKQMTIPWRNLYPDDHHSACEWPCIWPAVFGGSNQDGAWLFFAATYPDDDQRDPLRPPAQLRDGWGFLEAPDPPAPSHYTALPDITGQPLQCISAFYQKLAISCRCFRQHYSALEVCDTLCVLRKHLRWFGAFLGNIAKIHKSAWIMSLFQTIIILSILILTQTTRTLVSIFLRVSPLRSRWGGALLQANPTRHLTTSIVIITVTNATTIIITVIIESEEQTKIEQ